MINFGTPLHLACAAILFAGLQFIPAFQAQADTALCGQPIRVGVRDDAPPFSYMPSALLSDPDSDRTAEQCSPDGSMLPGHAGFTVSICDDFLTRLSNDCAASGLDAPGIEIVSLSASQRIDALLGVGPDEVDLLCGATTATVWMSGRLPRTLYTFVTPTRAMLPDTFGAGEVQNCRIGVIGGTTSSQQRTDKTMLSGWGRFISGNTFCGQAGELPTVAHAYENYPEALSDLLLAPGKAQSDLLIGDHHILRWYRENWAGLSFADQSEEPDARIDQRSFTLEPYAIFGGHDDQALVAALNLHLAEMQRDGTFATRVTQCFGRRVDESLLTLLEIQQRIPMGAPDVDSE